MPELRLGTRDGCFVHGDMRESSGQTFPPLSRKEKEKQRKTMKFQGRCQKFSGWARFRQTPATSRRKPGNSWLKTFLHLGLLALLEKEGLICASQPPKVSLWTCTFRNGCFRGLRGVLTSPMAPQNQMHPGA